MVGLDHSRVPPAGFNHVGVNGALGQEVDRLDFLADFFKDLDKFIPNGLALGFGIADSGQAGQKPVFGIDTNKVHAGILEGSFYLVALVLPHEAVVDKDAGQAGADGFGQEGGHDGGVDTTRQAQEDLAVPYLVPHLGDGGLGVIGHGPGAFFATNVVNEIAEHLSTFQTVVDLGVELEAINLALVIRDGGQGAVGRRPNGGKALGQGGHPVGMAHPHLAGLGNVLKQAMAGMVQAGLAKFLKLRLSYLAAQAGCDKLHAVAEAQDGDAQLENLPLNLGSLILVNRAGPAGENQAGRMLLLGGGQGLVVGHKLAIDVQVPDPPGDQLAVLAAKVNY